MKTLAIDELIGYLKVHKQELMDETQSPKGKIIALKASQKIKTRNQSKALNLEVMSDVENNDDEPSKEDEEELAFLTKRVKRFLDRKSVV